MRIHDIALPLQNPDAAAAWFAQVLQVPVHGCTLRIGWTTVRLLQAQRAAKQGALHLAFNVPYNRFAAAQHWLRERVPLQRDDHGEDCFALPDHWRSQSVYFAGPEGMVLELIARARLPSSSAEGAFDGRELTCVSEVGLPTGDVARLQSQAETQLGLQPLSPAGTTFAALGDDEGLLIVVCADRRWFPEQTQLPAASGVELTVRDTGGSGSLHDAQQGWSVRSS